MITQDQLDAAQAALDAAQANFNELQAQFAAQQPHLSVLQEIEQWIARVPGELQAEGAALVAKARALI